MASLTTADLSRARPQASIRSTLHAPGPDIAVVLAATILVATMLAGMMLHVSAIALGASAASFLVAIVNPSVGLAVLAFMATLVGPTLPAPGFQTIQLLATLAGCVYRLPIDRPQFRIGPPMLLLFAILGFVTVQQLPSMVAGYASLSDHDVGYLYFQLITGIGAIVVAAWIIDGRSPFPTLAMAMAGVFVGSLVALIPYVAPTFAVAIAPLTGQSIDPVRVAGTFGNPNFMGGSAAISMAAALSLLVGAESRRVRVALACIVVALALCVAISLSRGAVIAAFVGVVVALSRTRRSAMVVILIGIVAALVIYPLFVEWRLASVLGSVSQAAVEATSESDSARLDGILGGVYLFLSSPIVGVGFGHYLAAFAQIPGVLSVHAAHNWYTYLLGEQGLVGVTLWIALIGAVAVRLRKLPVRPRSLGVSVLATTAAACLFLEIPTSYQTFALPAICLVAALVSRWPPSPNDADGGSVSQAILPVATTQGAS